MLHSVLACPVHGRRKEERRLFRFPRHSIAFWVVVLASTPACNVVLGNEDGVLDDDGTTPELDIDAGARTPDSGISMEPDTSVEDPTADADGATRDGGVTADVSTKDAARSDAADGSRGDAGSLCDTGASICAEGQTATEMQACGPCGRGVQSRKRTCAPGGCGWGEWSAWSTCSVTTAECMPGQTANESQACGLCNTGTQSRTRTCTNSCTWGAWSAFGACGNVTAECQPDHWRCCGAGKWEWCYYNTCKWTHDCAPCNGSCSC